MDTRILHTIRFQVAAALLLQFFFLISLGAYSLNELNKRRYDYDILNMVGQMRALSQRLLDQSINYDRHAPRDYEAYDRDLGLYRNDLHTMLTTYDRLATMLTNCLAAGMGHACRHDHAIKNRLHETAAFWQRFHKNVHSALGPDDEPRLEAAAEYIAANGEKLIEHSTALSTALQQMMEEKLEALNNLNRIAFFVALGIAVVILLALRYQLFRPLDQALSGFNEVAQGRFDHRVPTKGHNEIAQMSRQFNALVERLDAIFSLTARLNKATDLDQTLASIQTELKGILPIDWIGILRVEPGTEQYSVERHFFTHAVAFKEGDRFDLPCPILSRALETRQPVYSPLLDEEAKLSQVQTSFPRQLLQDGFKSILLLLLSTENDQLGALAFAARQENAYRPDQLELLKNINAQVRYSFEKTLGMENLIISTVEGLAKMAESRDPETGDHLFRMSHFALFICRRLAEEGPYSDQIDTAFIRDVFRFAPMHDIGKVGIADGILLKPGRLNDEEFNEMQRHPTIGANVLKRCEDQMQNSGLCVFKRGIEIAEGHHEKFNGNGYPNGIKGTDIPLSARIVAVADVFDALTSKRPYKEAWPVEKAIDLIRKERGEHFDPAVVDAFEQALPDIMAIYNEHKHV